ncbi:MAG: hypothetical protein LBG92_06515 [Prevotellaceae bacterium]|jgi:hypothetical protein|nr:hypothetical protein [Prevotellaceae bacterium]
MSCVVKTVTPFINQELLLQALDKVGCKYTLQGNEILIDRIDYFGNQKFVFAGGRYIFQHDRDQYGLRNFGSQASKDISHFLESIEKEYNTLYQNKLEELECQRLEAERIRLEQERQAFVEKQKSSIIAKAKEMGYSIKEERVKEKIKLVLVRNTY